MGFINFKQIDNFIEKMTKGNYTRQLENLFEYQQQNNTGERGG